MKLADLLREPMLRFLAIGLGLFVAHGLVAPAATDGRDIVVSQARVDGLVRQYQATWHRPPTPDELAGLVDAYVRDEVLYREGVALGLDSDDPVIQRRIRQKMEVAAEERLDQAEPGDAELEAYLARFPERFARAPVVAFDQILLGAAEDPGAQAAAVASALAALDAGTPPSTLGRASLLPSRVPALSLDQVARDFGAGFAVQLPALPLGRWQGPLTSALGTHLVRLNARQPGRLPPLAEIRPQVQREWEHARRESNREAAYRAMRANYRVTIAAKTLAGAGTP